jgi:hypothetical protein
MTKAQVLLPSADVLKASARVLTVQADGREDQFHRKTRKIAKMPRFILLPFPPKRQRRGIVVASKPPMAQAPFRSDLIGWRFAGASRFGVGKRRLKIARRFNAGGDVENQSPGRDDRKCQPFLRDFWWPCASIQALKCRGSSGTVFHRGSQRESALTFPPEENARPAPTRRQPHGKFQPPREGKLG